MKYNLSSAYLPEPENVKMLQDGWDSALSTELRELILSELPCGLCVARWEEELSFVYANENFYRMFGYPGSKAAREEGVSGAFDCVDGEAKRVIQLQLDTLSKSGEPTAAFEVRLRRQDGSFVWSMVRVCSAGSGKGLWICAFMDISAQKRVEEELRVREEEYRIAIRQSDKLVFRYDIEKNVAHLPPESAERFEMDALIDIAKNFDMAKVVHPDSQDVYREVFEQIRSGNQPSGSALLQLCLGKEEGVCEWYRVTYSLIYREDHSPAQAVISLENVSEQHAREVAYQRWEHTYEAMPQINTAYLEFDLTQNRLELQKGELMDTLPGAWSGSMESAVRYYLDRYVHADDRERVRTFIAREHLLTEYFRGTKLVKPEYRHLRADGRYGWVRLSVQMLPDPYSSNIRASFLLKDIDAQKREELNLMDQLRTDMLTGVLNRGAFVEAMEELFQEGNGAGQHALVMVDVDHFKQINDRFGHHYGDRVLIRACNALRAALRTDDLVGRIGGDEFVLLLKNVLSTNALQAKVNSLCEQLCQRVSSDIVVSCSFGAAICPRDGVTFDELYKKADTALYAAKEAGRNCARVYESDMGMPVALFDSADIE